MAYFDSVVVVVCLCSRTCQQRNIDTLSVSYNNNTEIQTVICTTKIGQFVCPPNISETKLISKPSLLSILLKTIQRIGASPKRKSSPPFVCSHGQVSKLIHSAFLYVKHEFAVYLLLTRCQRHTPRYYVLSVT